jgi:hypothetical protein
VVLRPGVRVDLYDDTHVSAVSIDPRFIARVRMIDAAPELWLKGSVGLYHQPPRFAIPVPGLDQIALQKGLLESAQAMLGVDLSLGGDFSLDAQTYFNWMDPLIADTSLNPSADELQQLGPLAPPGAVPPVLPRDARAIDQRFDQLLIATSGRAYGLELLLRRQSTSGLAGWISYTLSRSERFRDHAWAGFDFDRTHILNLVLSLPLARAWQIGIRAQYLSGRPLSTTSGLATARADDFLRFDLRLDKTAVFYDWLLDFYVDITNVVLASEELAPESRIRYVLPTAGLRAIF